MTELYYDEDNFSGRYSREPRYRILNGSMILEENLSESDVDYLCEIYERQGYENIKVEEM